MSGLAVARPDDNGPGITSQQTTHTAPLTLGTGAVKKVILAQHAGAGKAEFSYALLEWAGGPIGSNYYYAIVSVEDFPASRLLSELTLQFGFSKVEIATLSDGTKFTLSPKIFGLQIKHKGLSHRFTENFYGEGEILGKLNSLALSPDGDEYDFLIAMERVNYDMGSGSVINPADVINAYPDKLISLINVVLKLGVLLTDIKVRNLSVKCSSSRSCELGVIDLDKKFVADVTGWNWLVNLGLTGAVHAKLAEQYMVLMVCFVGLNNGLNPDTKKRLLKMVGLADFTETGDFKSFDVAALNRMLQYEALKKQIKHYLGFNQSRTRDIGQEFNDEYVKGELLGAVVKSDSAPAGSIPERPRYDSSTPDSSLDGGKSRRKHKKTRKRKPKSKKTRRKRSLLNRAKMWDR